MPIIIAGTKVDLKNDQRTLQALQQKGVQPISKDQGEALAKRIGAEMYCETSAKTREGLKELFDNAIIIGLYPPKKKKNKCTIL